MLYAAVDVPQKCGQTAVQLLLQGQERSKIIAFAGFIKDYMTRDKYSSLSQVDREVLCASSRTSAPLNHCFSDMP